MGTQTAPNAGREQWVDVAKGAAILLVVLHHSVIFLDAVGLTPGVLDSANTVLGVMRMPLFFLASGIFAASGVAKSWTTVWNRKLSLFLYIYVAWSMVRFLVFQVIPWPLPDVPAGALRTLLLVLVWPSSGLWYVFALALFFVGAKLLRGAPTWAVLAGAAILSALVGSGVLSTGNTGWDNMGTYFVFFMVACRFGGELRAVAARLPWWAFAPTGLVFVTVCGAAYAVHAEEVPGVRLLVSVTAVGFALAAAAALSRVRAGAPLAWFGQRTLPIYLVHYIVIAALVAGLRHLPVSSVAVQVALVVAVTAVAVALSLTVHAAARRVPGLWSAPAALLVSPQHSRRTATPARV